MAEHTCTHSALGKHVHCVRYLTWLTVCSLHISHIRCLFINLICRQGSRGSAQPHDFPEVTVQVAEPGPTLYVHCTTSRGLSYSAHFYVVYNIYSSCGGNTWSVHLETDKVEWTMWNFLSSYGDIVMKMVAHHGSFHLSTVIQVTTHCDFYLQSMFIIPSLWGHCHYYLFHF